MKVRKATAAGLLLLGLSSPAGAVSPCVERPTPPPCCADGHCYPNFETWGVYKTRWRPWPTDIAVTSATGPVGQPPAQSVVPPFEAPPAEEEDRRAPPPTPPREEGAARATSPATGSGETATPPQGQGPEGRVPPPGPPRPTAEPGEPVGPRRLLPPYSAPAPGPRPSGSTGPSSDADPPPALPFGPALSHDSDSQPQAAAPPQMKRLPVVPVASPKLVGVNLASDDPPPAPPIMLGNTAN